MTDDAAVLQWLELKRQQLLINRQLEALGPVAQQLLIDRRFDPAAREIGIELTRPDRTVYHYARDPHVLQLQQQQEQLRTQVQEAQRRFRDECLLGRRELDVDFTPQRQLTVQLRRPV
jgi:hypothetical protein